MQLCLRSGLPEMLRLLSWPSILNPLLCIEHHLVLQQYSTQRKRVKATSTRSEEYCTECSTHLDEENVEKGPMEQFCSPGKGRDTMVNGQTTFTALFLDIQLTCRCIYYMFLLLKNRKNTALVVFGVDNR